MRSSLVEFHRFGHELGILREGDPYLLVREDRPVVQVEMPLHHKDFLRRSSDLRYAADEQQRNEAIAFLLGKVSEFLATSEFPGEAVLSSAETVQLDLVLNAAELSALPFELALAVDN